MALQGMEVENSKQIERTVTWSECKVEKRFVVPEENAAVELQYYLLYESRLETLKPILEEEVARVWGPNCNACSRVLDAQTQTSNMAVVIFGTLYKEMAKKKSVLDEFHDEFEAPTDTKTEECEEMVISGRFVSEDDYLLIEDAHGNLRVNGACLNVNKLFTGIVVALRGKLSKDDGIFQVSDYLLPGVPPVSPHSINIISSNSNLNNNSNSTSNTNTNIEELDEFIAFISDLRFANIPDATLKSHFDIQLVFDFLSGFLGDFSKDQLNSNSKISRLIIAGNILGEDEMPSELDDMRYDKAYLKRIDQAREKLDYKLKDLDLWLSQIAMTLNIDIMPGKIDPANELLPQSEFHHSLFPLSTQYDSFKCVTNPYSLSLSKNKNENEKDNNNNNNNNDGNGTFTILGCSGENIDNMLEHGLITDMEGLELTLNARNIAPTAPDTLTCFPYRKNDPFLIENSPNIYFVGSRNQFDYKYANNKQTLLLCVPSFAKTQQIVLVNKNSLECKVIQFGHRF